MSEVPSWLATGFSALGGSSLVLGILWLMGKWVDKHKPKHEVMDSIVASLQRTIEHQSEQIHALEKDVKALRSEIRAASIRSHQLYIHIQDFLVEYPHHGDWWARKLSKMEL